MNPVVWVQSHPAEIALAFGAITAIVNTALRFKTAEEWIEFADRKPRTAALMRLCRAIGVDPVKAVLAIQTALNARNEKEKSK